MKRSTQSAITWEHKNRHQSANKSAKPNLFNELAPDCRSAPSGNFSLKHSAEGTFLELDTRAATASCLRSGDDCWAAEQHFVRVLGAKVPPQVVMNVRRSIQICRARKRASGNQPSPCLRYKRQHFDLGPDGRHIRPAVPAGRPGACQERHRGGRQP